MLHYTNVHSHIMYCIESTWKTSKCSAGFTNWWPEHHTAYDHFKCSCLRWVCLTAILIKSVTKSPWRNCCDYKLRPFSWVLGSQAVDTTPPPPPPTLLSWAWVASLATISWLSSTPIMLTFLSVSHSWLTFIAWPFGWPIYYDCIL